MSLKLEDMLHTQDLPDHDSFCLVINNHFKVEIRAGFDAQLLRQLIFALRGVAMIPENTNRVYLALGSTDMRKAINGLSVLVEQAMDLNPFSGDLFVFCNRRQNIIKILYWDFKVGMDPVPA